MSWNISAIFVHDVASVDSDLFMLQTQVMRYYQKIDVKTFADANLYSQSENEIYVGKYKNNIIIVLPTQPLFFSEKLNMVEKNLIQFFLDKKIGYIYLCGGMNEWGISYIEHNQKMRAKAGDGDRGTYIDFGAPLAVEEALLSQSKLVRKKRVYTLDAFPNETMTEDQVGENIVFDFCKHFTGQSLDKDDDLLFKTKLQGYLKLRLDNADDMNTFFSKKWLGRSTYPDNWPSELANTSFDFEFNLKLQHGKISGTITETINDITTKTSIDGHFADEGILFTKLYKATPIRRAAKVIYTGFYCASEQVFRGQWKGDYSNFIGTWEMKMKV